MILKAGNRTLSAGAIAVLCIFLCSVSCSGPGGQDVPPKNRPAAPARKSEPAKPGAGSEKGPSDWVGYGAAKDGSPIYYDTKRVERNPNSKKVKFWTRATPPRDSKVFTEAQKQIESAGKDPRLLHFFEALYEVNCSAMTYDLTKVALMGSDGKTLSEQAANVRGRKPGPDVAGLMEKLCAGPTANPPAKGSARGGPCERAGIMVLIQPEEAVKAGAQWRVEGGEWKGSGEAVCNLPVDQATQKKSYTIEYKPVPGSPFSPPAPHPAIASAEYKYSFYNALYISRPKDQKQR